LNSIGGFYSNGIGGGGQNNLNGAYNGILGARLNTISGSYSRTTIASQYLTANASYTTFSSYLYKVGGSFAIDHPNPAKSHTHQLIHSFVEAPTPDNIYRYKIQTCNCQASLELPSYYKFLNKNDQISVTANDNFGSAYGIMDESQSCVNFVSEVDGSFDVLIIGTRKDKAVSNAGRGVEVVNDRTNDIIKTY